MTDEIKPHEKPLLTKLNKIRPIVLKRLLIFHLKNKVYGIKSKRAKHDYVLALELFEEITKIKQQYPD